MYKLIFFKILYMFLLISKIAFAQNFGEIKGQIIDFDSEKPLEGASIKIEGTNIGVSSDSNGYFKIDNINTKTYNINISYLGYENKTVFNVIVKSFGTSNILIKLKSVSDDLDEVVLTSSPFKTSAETPLSTQTFSAVEIETYPGGNNDITKVAQSLPGISPSVGGFRNDFIIRGGAPNESVYYLDGIEIPNINHFSTQGSAGGPVGMLNIDFVREVTLKTSSFGAEFDNALSGVLIFDQRYGNDQIKNYKIRVGASEAGLTINTPFLKKNKERSKTSIMASIRRSYLQFIFKLVGLPIRPDYWDYQWKIDHKINDFNYLSFIGLGSIDEFSVEAPNTYNFEQQSIIDQVPIINQKSNTIGLTWKNNFKNGNGKIRISISRNMLNNSFNRYEDNERKKDLFFENDSKEVESKLRFNSTHYFSNLMFSYGLNIQESSYTNNTLNVKNNFKYKSSINFLKYGFFFKTSSSIFNEKINFSFGIRSDKDNFLSKSNFSKNFSPRFATSIKLDKRGKLKFNFSTGKYFKIPTYTMLGFKNNDGNFINKDLRYTQSSHYVYGLEYNFNSYSRITLETFIKNYKNYPTSIIDGVSIANKGGDFEVLGNEPVSDNGSGNSNGIELLYQQKLNKNFYGIFSYTHFYSKFSGFNKVVLPSVWDSRNLISFTGGLKLNRNWELSMRYRYAGKTPYVPVNLTETLISYPEIVLDYNSLGINKINAFNQADIRIDKKWNFKRFSFNFYFEIENFLVQSIPRPPEYGLSRDLNGFIISPKSLKEIDTSRSNTPIPTFGLVFDF